MKKGFMRTVITMMLVVSTVLFTAGCGKTVNAKTADMTYKSDQGWAVKYDPSQVTVKQNKDSATFIYTGNGAKDEKLTISYTKGVTPEKAVDAIAAGWTYPSNAVTDMYKSESYFPGSNTQWGYWRSMISDNKLDLTRDAFAGEYNDGVLIFDMATHTSDNGWRVLQDVMDSITYDNFAPQKMYEGIEGTYVMNAYQLINGKEVPVTYTVTLDKDHQGTIKLDGDEQYVMWGTYSLIQADNSFDYSVNGNTLTLNVDGSQLIFTK